MPYSRQLLRRLVCRRILDPYTIIIAIEVHFSAVVGT